MSDRVPRAGGNRNERDIPEPPVVAVEDWPPASRTDQARAELDREVGTLDIGGNSDDAEPQAWARGTPEADAQLGTGVMGRGEDILTKGEARGLAADPGLPLEPDEKQRE